jgi:hypothetical protein
MPDTDSEVYKGRRLPATCIQGIGRGPTNINATADVLRDLIDFMEPFWDEVDRQCPYGMDEQDYF